MNKKLPFFGKTHFIDREKQTIFKILKKYKSYPVTEDLKQKIYDDLMQAKSEGHISIPFQITLRQDPSSFRPSYVEILLETKI